MKTCWNRLADLINQHERFMLTCHARPDCDALGSELGMAALLKSLGKSVTVVNVDPTPSRLAFIDPKQQIQVLGKDVGQGDLLDIDVIIVLDTSAPQQLGKMNEILRTTSAKVAVIDHHASDGELDVAVMCKDERAEATGRLVYQFAQQLGISLTVDLANPLFAALATDTGWFRFSSVSSATYRIAADLIDAGVCPHTIYNHLYEQDSLNRVKLRAITLDHLQIEQSGRLAWTYLAADDFANTGAEQSDTEDFINMALAIAGTEVAIMFSQNGGESVKVSFRSRTQVDCSKLAEQFGGGGHRAAAGATVRGSLEDVRNRILEKARAILA